MDGNKYDLKNGKIFLPEIINKKITENEARELYNNLIKPDIIALKKSTSRGKDKRNNILTILGNVKSVVFDDLYFNYHDKRESKSEENIAERAKLKNQRLKEIVEKEKMIYTRSFEEYFGYSSPSAMYKTLNETAGLEESKAQVNTIENILTSLVKKIESRPTNDVIKIKNRNNMLEIVEIILYFNQPNQSGQGLKILTLNRKLSRLPISLAQLKAGNNSEKLKNKIRQLLYSLYRSEKLTKIICNNLINTI